MDHIRNIFEMELKDDYQARAIISEYDSEDQPGMLTLRNDYSFHKNLRAELLGVFRLLEIETRFL